MKGISEVVSVALLLGVAVAVAGVYADWAPGFAENITSRAAESSDADLRCDNAALSVNSPSYDGSGNLLSFDIENTGSIRFTGEITMIALNSSAPVNNTSFTGLDVGETRSSSMIASRSPDSVVASSESCPMVSDREESIEVVD